MPGVLAWGHRPGANPFDGKCSLTFLPLFLCQEPPCCPCLYLHFLAMPGDYCPEQGRFCNPLCLIFWAAHFAVGEQSLVRQEGQSWV